MIENITSVVVEGLTVSMPAKFDLEETMHIDHVVVVMV
jgi:hypothetical protein